MDILKDFNAKNFYAKLVMPESEEWFQSLKLLPVSRICFCGNNMSRRKRKGRESWRCTKYSCRKEVGYFKVTFFDGTHLTFKEVFLSDLFNYNIYYCRFSSGH